ncbi:MAG: AAA family ATPase, partial [Pseudomonadales bacterium]|nr:AAA family ATPase [Pseudomonadales bacterium]
MKIKNITIKNFRCFEQLEVTFHPQMTVLIAANGGGKTSILDAVRIAVWPFVKGFDLGSQTG